MTNDPLARTATAPPYAEARGAAVPVALAHEFGRYRIEGEIGSGGMGIVYRAFDPDLERAVALKVLRDDTTPEARKRLLREARTLARLAHPNVVAVHEVGTVSGRDFISMELVEGASVADWLRAAPRDAAAVLEVFVAAGEGLAAAHKKGVVHRDFKPHNILRSRDGRVHVTDFGLACTVDDIAPVDVFAQTVDGSAPGPGSEPPPTNDIAATKSEGFVTARHRSDTSEPASASGSPFTIHASTPASPSARLSPARAGELTRTGALLGTPAYMPPEQWEGKTVGPAGDQYSWAVALWEALTGHRPFAGDTLDALRANVVAGQPQTQGTPIPRRIRRVLLRAMAAQPERRWPSMPDLLLALHRARRPRWPLVAGGLAAATVTLLVAYSGARAPVEACPAPAQRPEAVWSAALAEQFGGDGKHGAAAALTEELSAWHAARVQACKAAPKLRATQTACLDGVLARIAVTKQAFTQVPPAIANFEPRAFLLEAATCLSDAPPSLTAQWPENTSTAVALRARSAALPRSVTLAEANALVTSLENKPACVRGLALLTRAALQRDAASEKVDLDEAAPLVEECNDDALRAALAANIAAQTLSMPFANPQFAAVLRRADTAVKLVGDSALQARVLVLKARAAIEAKQHQVAGELYSQAAQLYAKRKLAARELDTVLAHAALFLDDPQARQSELQAALQHITRLRSPELAINNDFQIAIAEINAAAAWLAGNGALAQTFTREVMALKAYTDEPTIAVQGQVRDAQGAPVANATVVASPMLRADNHALVNWLAPRGTVQTHSDASGHFAFPHAPAKGIIAAELGDQRSRALAIAAQSDVQLQATSRITGRVIPAAGMRPTYVVALPSQPTDSQLLSHVTPVATDGTFTFAKLPLGRIRLLSVVASATAPAAHAVVELTTKPIENVVLQATPEAATRTVYVIMRSLTMPQPNGGQVVVIDEHASAPNVKELRRLITSQTYIATAWAEPLVGEKVPAPLLGKVPAGALVAELHDVPRAPKTLCGLGLAGDLGKREFWTKMEEHLDRVGVTCVALAADQTIVFIDVPAMPRFD